MKILLISFPLTLSVMAFLERPFQVSEPYDDLSFVYLLLVWSCTQCEVYKLKSPIVVL